MQFFTILFGAVVAAAPAIIPHMLPAASVSEPLVARARMMHRISDGKPEPRQHIRDYTPKPEVPPMPPKLPRYSSAIRLQDLPYIVAEAGEERVQVGELTGNALYNATVSALDNLCPGEIGGCEQNRHFVIPGIKSKAPNDLVANTGTIDISVEAQLERMPMDLLKNDLIHIIASVLAKQSDNEGHCEHIETPCHFHECLPSISVSTLLCNVSSSVAVYTVNSTPPIQMTAALVFRSGSNATVSSAWS